MFKFDYKNELDNINASKDFKEETILLLKQKQFEKDINYKKTIHFTRIKIMKIASFIAIAIICMSIYLYNNNFFIKGYEKSSADNSNLNLSKKYNINDSKELSFIEDNNKIKVSKKEKPINRLLNQNNNSSEIGREQIYSTNDIFKTLSIYKSNLMSKEQISEFINIVCESFDIDNNVDFTWLKYDYNENKELIVNEEFHTNSLEPISNNAILYSAHKEFENGSFNISVLEGKAYITINNIKIDSENKNDIINNLVNKFIKSDNSISYLSQTNATDSSIIHTKVYETSENYSDNIFNFSLNNSNICICKNNVTDSYIAYIDINFLNAHNIQNLPAINYKEALNLLYNKKYITFDSKEVTDETIVSHINLVYKDYYYNKNENNVLFVPFYEFFVENQNESDKSYSTYYVCAIHPSIIEVE